MRSTAAQGSDSEGGDAAAAQFVDQGDDFAVGRMAVGGDGDGFTAGGGAGDGGGQLCVVELRVVEVNLCVRGDTEGGSARRGALGGACLWKTEFDAFVIDVAGGDHENYQQHQHHIHERGDVDAGNLILMKIFQYRHYLPLHLWVRFSH